MYYTFTPIPIFLQLQVLSNLFFSSVADQYAAFLGARLRLQFTTGFSFTLPTLSMISNIFLHFSENHISESDFPFYSYKYTHH